MRHETLAGYLVDVASFLADTGSPLTKARAHPRERLLAGAGRETAYGLVFDDGRLKQLDADASTYVEGAVRANPHACGIRVEVERVERGGEMHTVAMHTLEGRLTDMTGGKEGRGGSRGERSRSN